MWTYGFSSRGREMGGREHFRHAAFGFQLSHGTRVAQALIVIKGWVQGIKQLIDTSLLVKRLSSRWILDHLHLKLNSGSNCFATNRDKTWIAEYFWHCPNCEKHRMAIIAKSVLVLCTLLHHLSCSTLPAERLLTVGKDQVHHTCKRFHEGQNSWYHEAYQEKNQERIQMGICQVRGGDLNYFVVKETFLYQFCIFFKTLLKSRGGPTNPKISCCKLAKVFWHKIDKKRLF